MNAHPCVSLRPPARARRAVRTVGCAGMVLLCLWAARSPAAVTQFGSDTSGNSASRTTAAGPVAPTIVSHPVSRTGALGRSATFSVIATGIPSPTYQWKRHHVDIRGATSATLLMQNLQAADFDDYSVVVTNSAGSATSNLAQLLLDSDGDRLPDAWELAKFGNLKATTHGDADNDGITNLKECIDGTEPNSGASAQYPLTLAEGTRPSNTPVNPFAPMRSVDADGANTVKVQSVDLRDSASSQVTRGSSVRRSLVVNANASLGSVTAGFSPTSFREVGKTFTITATAKPPTSTPSFGGAIFTGWALGGQDVANGDIPFTPQRLGTTTTALEEEAITFIFREGLELTANFVANPYDATVAGTYNGLIKASASEPDRTPPGAGTEDGTAPAVGSEGYFTATVQSTGAFSGKLTIDGVVLNVAGQFDDQGRARFGNARAPTLMLARTSKPGLIVEFEIGGPAGSAPHTGQITGQVTTTDFKKRTITAVSKVTADRAHFTGLTAALTVPDPYLTVTGAAPPPAGRRDGRFTVTLPSIAPGSQPPRIAHVLTAQDYPQGDGVGTLKVSKAGLVTLTATLADGTPVTASGTLSQDLRVALFAQLYTLKGFLSAQVKLDSGQADSDLKTAVGAEVIWSRPFMSKSQYYPYGWPEVLGLDLRGARYVAAAGRSVLKAPDGLSLEALDADGNVSLTFSGGHLTTSLDKFANLSTADVVTKVPANDATFTMIVNRATGAITGTFAHPDDTMPSYNAIIFQKGPNAGARGFFLTKQPVPLDYTGESGKVNVIGQP